MEINIYTLIKKFLVGEKRVTRVTDSANPVKSIARGVTPKYPNYKKWVNRVNGKDN